MIAIIPRQVAYRLWKYAVLRVRALHGFSEAVDDIEVGAAVRDRLNRAMAPLRPAPAVDDAAFLLDAGTGRQNKDLGGDSSRINTGPLPELRGLVLEQIGDHEPIELVDGRTDQPRVGAADHGILAEAEEPLDFARQHRVGEREKRIALSFETSPQLRQVGKVEVVLALGVIAPPRLEQAHDILGRVLQPVGALRIGRHRSDALQIALEVDIRFHRQLEIAGQTIPVQSLIRRTLHVGFAAHSVDAAAGDANVAEQKLQDGIGTDVLRAVAVLRRAHGIEPGARAIGSVSRGVKIANPQVIFFGCAGDTAHRVGAIAGEVLLQ